MDFRQTQLIQLRGNSLAFGIRFGSEFLKPGHDEKRFTNLHHMEYPAFNYFRGRSCQPLARERRALRFAACVATGLRSRSKDVPQQLQCVSFPSFTVSVLWQFGQTGFSSSGMSSPSEPSETPADFCVKRIPSGVSAPAHANDDRSVRRLCTTVSAADSTASNHLRQKIRAALAHRLGTWHAIDGRTLIASHASLFVVGRRRASARGTWRRTMRSEPNCEIVHDSLRLDCNRGPRDRLRLRWMNQIAGDISDAFGDFLRLPLEQIEKTKDAAARVAQLVQRLADGVNAIVVQAAREGSELIFKARAPRRTLGEENSARFVIAGCAGGSRLFVAVHLNGNYGIGCRQLQLLDERLARRAVFDVDFRRLPEVRLLRHLPLELREFHFLAVEREQIKTVLRFADCGAHGIVVRRACLEARIPTLDDARELLGGRSVGPEPIAFENCSVGRRDVPLVETLKDPAADIGADGVQ